MVEDYMSDPVAEEVRRVLWEVVARAEADAAVAVSHPGCSLCEATHETKDWPCWCICHCGAAADKGKS